MENNRLVFLLVVGVLYVVVNLLKIKQQKGQQAPELPGQLPGPFLPSDSPVIRMNPPPVPPQVTIPTAVGLSTQVSEWEETQMPVPGSEGEIVQIMGSLANPNGPSLLPENFNQATLIKGIIMAEILQPPKALRLRQPPGRQTS